MSTDRRQQIGALGERVAARWYGARGWAVLAHRFRAGHRDLDLVVRADGLVAFVEVKTRCGPAFGGPLVAVGWKKRREIVRSAQVWMTRHGQPGDAYRFDVFGVEIDPAATPPRVRVAHRPDAFQVTAGQ